MKKKLIPLILALICAMACAILFAACGGGGDDGDNGGDKTVTGLVVVDDNGNEYDNYDLGNVVYGQTPDISSLKLYAKYSDGTKTLLQNTDSGVSITYRHNNETIDAPSGDVGAYLISYSYEHFGASVEYNIVTSATATPYTLSLNKTTLKYPEEPTITVKKSETEINADKYTVYVVTSEEYDEIKDAANFKEQLEPKQEVYDGRDIKPGAYYLFAYVDSKYNSDFVRVTVNKGDVTPTTVEDCSGHYSYNTFGDIGQIKLSQVTINNSSVLFKNSNGEDVSGDLYWQNPEEKVDSTNDGEKRPVSWSPTGEYVDCYNDCTVTEQITVNVEKGYVDVPKLRAEDGGYIDENTYKVTYDGQAHDIKLYEPNDGLEIFKARVKVTRGLTDGLTEIDVGEGGELGTRTEIGKDRYTFYLKDNVNYYWLNTADYDDKTDVTDKWLEYEIIARQSCVNLDGNYAIDGNKQVKIQLKPGAVLLPNGDFNPDGDYNVTPYEGALTAEVLATYEEGNTYKPTVVATATVENDGSSDWLVITVSEFKEQTSDTDYVDVSIIIKFTATGADHYADIDAVELDIVIGKYDVTCPIDGTEPIKAPVGTTVEAMYTTYYPTLTTPFGKWVLYANLGGESGEDWRKLTDDDTLPEGELSCKLVFEAEPSNAQFITGNTGEVLFTLIGEAASTNA